MKALREKYYGLFKDELFKSCVPFWLNNGVDTRFGGVKNCLDRTGKVYSTDKSVWMQGRTAYTFSHLCNQFGLNEEYLRFANSCLAFEKEYCIDKEDGRMYFTVTEDGRGLQKRRYYFSETFAAIGAAELYRATGREEHLNAALRYFDVAYECFTGVRKNPPKINPENSKMKALSPVMIMLSTASVMRSTGKNTEKYAAIAKSCADEIISGGFLTEYGLLESVTADGRFSDTPGGRVINPGHSLECAWFLMEEGKISGNDLYVEKALEIIEKTVKVGFDKRNGGIIAFTDCLGYPPTALEWDMKLWWPQCEALIAFRLANMLTGEEKYERLYKELLEYTEKHFVDAEYGEWYGYLHYDNTPSTTLKGNIFKGPFHIPRFYMIMALMDEGSFFEKY